MGAPLGASPSSSSSSASAIANRPKPPAPPRVNVTYPPLGPPCFYSGEREDDAMADNQMVDLARRVSPWLRTGDPSEYRDMSLIDDLIRNASCSNLFISVLQTPFSSSRRKFAGRRGKTPSPGLRHSRRRRRRTSSGISPAR